MILRTISGLQHLYLQGNRVINCRVGRFREWRNTFTSQAKKVNDNDVSCIATLPHEADCSAVSLKLAYLVDVKMGLFYFCSLQVIPSLPIKALQVINYLMPLYLHSQITNIFVHKVFILVWEYEPDVTGKKWIWWIWQMCCIAEILMITNVGITVWNLWKTNCFWDEFHI